MWGGAAALGAAGFGYMASGASPNPTYASTNDVTVNGYAIYDVTSTPAQTGTVGYIHFNDIPMDNSHQTNSWPAYGAVEVAGNWYSCTPAWGGTDTRTNSYTDSYNSGTGVTDNGSPQATWTCDVRDVNGNGIPASTIKNVNKLTFLVQS